MKRIFAALLVLLTLLSAAGCAAQPDPAPSEAPSPGESSSIPTAAPAEPTPTLLGDLTLCPGDRYYEPLPIPQNGEALVTMSQEGILELIDFFWATEDSFFLDFQGISPGDTTVSIEVGEKVYQLNVSVVPEPTVKMTDGTLLSDISVDKTDATVYVDDTTVTYTLVTSPTVDRLVFQQIASQSPLYSYNSVISGEISVFPLSELVIDDAALTDTITASSNHSTYTAKKELRDGQLVWTVAWDLGYTAVSLLQITALDSSANLSHTGYVHLNISYPVFDPSQGLEAIALYWLKLNMDEPLLFTVDTARLTERQQYISDNYDKAAIFESEAFLMNGLTGDKNFIPEIYYLQSEMTNLEYYNYAFDSSPLFHMNTIDALNPYGLISVVTGNDLTNPEYYPQLKGKNRLVTNYYMQDATYVFYGSISQDMRAIMAYLTGYTLDAQTFPYAASVLKRGSEVISQIITDDMTDFEKEKAIYDWMIANYTSGLKSLPQSTTTEETYYIVKTAYGLLNGYHADCSGWSATFFTLCTMAGLPCTTVDVQAQPGGGIDWYTENFSVDHRINLIRLDGEFYFVEVFWFYQKASQDDGDYRYMNMTTQQAAQLYTWVSGDYFGPVECQDTSFLVDAHTGARLTEE